MTLSDANYGVTISTWGRFTEGEVEYQRWSVRSAQPRFFIDLPADLEAWRALSYACAAAAAAAEIGEESK